MLVLSAVSLLFMPVYSWLALGLILVALYSTIRPVPIRFRIVITIGFIYYLPLLLQPFLSSLAVLSGIPVIVSPVLSAMSVLPVIYLLDNELKQQANHTGAFAGEKDEGPSR